MAHRDESDGGQRYPGEASGLLGAVPARAAAQPRRCWGCWRDLLVRGAEPGAERGGREGAASAPRGRAGCRADLPGRGHVKKLRGADGLNPRSVHRVG